MVTKSDLPAVDLFLTPAVTQRIDGCAKRLCRKFALCGADGDDLRQDFRLVVLQARRGYDPAKCPIDRFVLMVINRRYKHHVRQLMQLRNGRGNTPDAVGFDDVKPDLEMLLVDPQGESPQKRFELQHDIAIACRPLSRLERQICGLLMSGHSPAEAARELGVARSTVTRAMGRVRRHFADAGLNPTS